jgi:hypothetical protein
MAFKKTALVPITEFLFWILAVDIRQCEVGGKKPGLDPFGRQDSQIIQMGAPVKEDQLESEAMSVARFKVAREIPPLRLLIIPRNQRFFRVLEFFQIWPKRNCGLQRLYFLVSWEPLAQTADSFAHAFQAAFYFFILKKNFSVFNDQRLIATPFVIVLSPFKNTFAKKTRDEKMDLSREALWMRF